MRAAGQCSGGAAISRPEGTGTRRGGGGVGAGRGGAAPRGGLVHEREDALVVRAHGAERLLQLLVALFLVQLREHLLQTRRESGQLPARAGARMSWPGQIEAGTHIVEAVQPLLHLQPVRTLRTLVRRVHMLQDQHLHKSMELSL